MNLIAFSTAQDGSHSAPAGRPAPAILLTTLTLIAMLLCLLAVQSTGVQHAMAAPIIAAQTAADGTSAGELAIDRASATTPPASVPAGPPVFAPTLAAAGPTMRLAGAANQPAFCSENNSLGGGSASTGCSTPLVVGFNALIAQLPSVSNLTSVSGEFLVDSYGAIPPHLHRPSLTLLSISRV